MKQLNKSSLKRTKSQTLERYILFTILTLLFVFIFAQFVVLNWVGMRGPEITKIRNEQERLKLDNELKRAKINELTKASDIKEYAVTSLGLVPKGVESIDVSSDNVSAINK